MFQTISFKSIECPYSSQCPLSTLCFFKHNDVNNNNNSINNNIINNFNNNLFNNSNNNNYNNNNNYSNGNNGNNQVDESFSEYNPDEEPIDLEKTDDSLINIQQQQSPSTQLDNSNSPLPSQNQPSQTHIPLKKRLFDSNPIHKSPPNIANQPYVTSTTSAPVSISQPPENSNNNSINSDNTNNNNDNINDSSNNKIKTPTPIINKPTPPTTRRQKLELEKERERELEKERENKENENQDVQQSEDDEEPEVINKPKRKREKVIPINPVVEETIPTTPTKKGRGKKFVKAEEVLQATNPNEAQKLKTSYMNPTLKSQLSKAPKQEMLELIQKEDIYDANKWNSLGVNPSQLPTIAMEARTKVPRSVRQIMLFHILEKCLEIIKDSAKAIEQATKIEETIYGDAFSKNVDMELPKLLESAKEKEESNEDDDFQDDEL